jgi:hypothetical protein
LKFQTRTRIGVAVLAAVAISAFASIALGAQDLGLQHERLTREHSEQFFGIDKPLKESSALSLTGPQIVADPEKVARLAKGLDAEVVSAGVAGPNIDMMVPWPDNDDPTHLIACNEQGVSAPGVQSINIETGAAVTILTGTLNCDGIVMTPWHTILFSEETSNGRVYELIDPLAVAGVTLDRVTSIFSGGTGTCGGGTGACHFAIRPALGRLAFEGLAVYPNGIIYYGDENRPANGTQGGAYFKFIPDNLWAGGPPVSTLAASPLVAGDVYGLRLGKRVDSGSGAIDYGQGTQLGFGTWVLACDNCQTGDTNLRSLTPTLKLTGYYRPEDADIDLEALEAGNVHSCANNTGNEENDQFYGETICITDGTVAQAAGNTATPEVQLLVAGHPGLAMPDNMAYQPERGNWIIHEDADTEYLTPHNNDLWDCLPDGQDEDLLSDGCIRIATLNDLTAEWTGGIFDKEGERLWVSIQHNATGKGIVLEITGWDND